MQYHHFPDADLRVSRLCFGCWGIISDAHWGTRAEEESLQALRAALDAGVNFFDTAPMYGDGESERLLGRFLAETGRRGEIVVASKIRPDRMRPDEVIEECEDSLRRLGLDHLDLYQTHWTCRKTPLEDTWAAMLRLRDQGKVRHLGVCNAGPADLAAVLASDAKPLGNQVPYNPLWRMIEDEILPTCLDHGVGVLAYSPLMHGMLADKYARPEDVPEGRARTRHFSSNRPQTRHGEDGCEAETFAALDELRSIAGESGRSMAELSLAWICAQPGVAAVVAGARNAEQLTANLRFAEVPSEDETIRRVSGATQKLKDALGPNPDMWDAGPNARYR